MNRWFGVRPIFVFILLGTVLRLVLLSQPVLWGDEALTYLRVVYSYRDMLDTLQRDSFAPLHYELYWCIAQVLYLTPQVMRLAPTLSGIAMIPVMYWLARQLTDSWTANCTALFTATSAYLLGYSRDAKMYMDFWLFCACSMACLHWWLRGRRRVAWLAWIASSVVMVGLDALGMIAVAMMPLFVLTYRKMHWTQGLLGAIGLIVILAGPVGYYSKFNLLLQRTDQEQLNQASGTTWVNSYNAGRAGPDYFLENATAFLFSWEWPRAIDQKSIDPQTLRWLQISGVALLSAIGLGIFPWSRKSPAEESVISAPRSSIARRGLGPRSRWPMLLWLMVWLVLPAYAFYCNSMRGAEGPTDWMHSIGGLFDDQWMAVAVAGSGLAATLLFARPDDPKRRPIIRAMDSDPCFEPGSSGWKGSGSPQVACLSSPAGERWGLAPISVRLLSAYAAVVLILLLANGFMFPRNMDVAPRVWANAFIIGTAALFYAAGKTVRQRLHNVMTLAVAMSITLGLCAAIRAMSSPPTASIWMPRYIGLCWPAFAIAVCGLIGRLPTRALRWGVIGLLLIVNLQRFASQVVTSIVVDSHGNWLLEGSEPPLDLMARDILDSDAMRHETIIGRQINWSPRSTTHVYAFSTNVIESPGNGRIGLHDGRYYLTLLGQNLLSAPDPVRLISSGPAITFDQNIDPAHIARDVRAHPKYARLVVWDQIAAAAPNPRFDPLLQLLGTPWTLVDIERFSVKDHWIWADLGVARRREYIRRPS